MLFRTKIIIAALAALPFMTAGAMAQESAAAPDAPVVAANNPNNELFAKLKKQCDSSGCDKGSGDVCVEAAAMLTSETPPDDYRDMDKGQLRKIAIRLLERGSVSSNRARAMAYDLYTEGGIFGSLSNPSSDPVRAAELLDIMVKSGFIGGKLRQLRDSLSMLNNGTDKNAAMCKEGRAILAKGGLDPDSLRVANELDNAFLCDKQNSDQKK